MATTPVASVGGLATGLDTNSIIAQLVDVERAMANPIKARGNAANNALLSYAMIRTGMEVAAQVIGETFLIAALVCGLALIPVLMLRPVKPES